MACAMKRASYPTMSIPFIRLAPAPNSLPPNLCCSSIAQGRLALTDNLSKYLPDFPNGNNITLKQLLTHTSGIYNYTQDPKYAAHPEQFVRTGDLLNLAWSKPLDFVPGSKFDYSATNYLLLGMVIEKITSQKYEANIQEHILNTCSMVHSGFGFSGLSSAEKATGYNNIANRYQKATLTNTAGSNAANGLYGTTGDMLRWHNALHSYRLLPKDWQEIAYAPNKNRYALGWYIYTMYNKRFIQHSGTTPGFATFIMRQEEDDLFIIIMENMPHGELNRSIAYTILKSMYDKSYHTPIMR